MHAIILITINTNDLDIDNILLDEGSFETNLIYDTAYKIQYSTNPLKLFLDNVDGCIRKFDRTKYLELFHSGEKYERNTRKSKLT